MSCRCKQVKSEEIIPKLNKRQLVEFRHSICGKKFARKFAVCRCDQIKDPKPIEGNIHYRGCPMFEAWVLMRKQAVRDRLDSANGSLAVGPGQLFANLSVPAAGKQIRVRGKAGQVKYLGSTKRGVCFSVKEP